jgi:hypothetical protein
MPYDATQTFGGYGSNSSSTFDSTKPFGGYEVDKGLPNIWNFPGGLKPGEKESPANFENKKQFPWGDVTRFAGDALNSYAQSKSGQGGRSDGLLAGGGGGVSQSGDLTIVYPQSPTVIPGEGKSGLGGALGTLAGIGASFIPGLGPGIAAAMPAIGGSIGGAFG